MGFIDSKVDALEIEVSGHDYILRQSPGLLTSSRAGGTTGAVLWKITPLLANWLASAPPVLAGILHADAIVVELGCGLAGLIGLALSRLVKLFVLTDQDYVMKYLKENISANSASNKERQKKTKKKATVKPSMREENLKTLPLDWEKDSVENLRAVLPPEASINLVLLCDCVYNEYLVKPLVQTCVDVCRLGSSETRATVLLIAQQLRSHAIFEIFLDGLMKDFDVWRVPDEKISTDLQSGSGYTIHLAILKNLGRKGA